MEANLFESGSIEGGEGPAISHRRWWFLYTVATAVLVILLGRSFYLQVLHGSEFRVTAEGNRITAVPIPAPRGIMYDTNGIQLVENIASADVVLNPAGLPREENEAILIERLPALLPVTADEVRNAINQARSTARSVRLVAALDHDTLIALEREQDQLPGVEPVSSLVRRYFHGSDVASVLGYTSPVTAEELKDRPELRPTDITGKTGLESWYDEQLHGQHGVQYEEVDAAGRTQKQIDRQEPIAGADLDLTLDVELQQYITELLREGEHEAGAVVALDPRSGAVRALVSYPSYDGNAFSQPALRKEAAAAILDERQLLFNRAVSGTYPPGSTIKPFIAAGALAENIITPGTTYQSTGGLSIGIWNFPDWKAGGHGTTNVTKAIAESVNTFFYLITGGDETRTGLGVKRTTNYLAKFGWGAPTGIDIPSEADGFLPSPEWKEEVKEERWYIGDTYHLAIGQGDVLATPLQLAVSTAAVANSGTVYEPFVVRALTWPEKDPKEQSTTGHRTTIPAADIATVRQGMRETVTAGSGRSLSLLATPVAGKTGTSQISGTDKTHAWFTSFGPYVEPELVVTVLVERGGAGDKVAAPIARDIWQWWGDNRTGS